jgi:hypothetical protein
MEALSESPATRAHAEPASPRQQELPFGVRAAALLLANGKVIAVATVLGAVAGAAIGARLPRPYVDTAVIEVGMRFVNEPVEDPIQAGWRLHGALLDAAREQQAGSSVSITHRREEKTNALTRFFDASVRGADPVMVRAVLDRGIQRLLERHQTLHAHERQIMLDQVAILEKSTDGLEALIRDRPRRATPEEGDVDVHLLNAALFDGYRSINGTRSAISDVRTPATRVVGRAATVEREPSRMGILAAGGLLFGLVFGVSIAGARSVGFRSERAADRDPIVDPIIENLFAITAKYWILILVTAGLSTALGGSLGLMKHQSYEGVVVVAMARVNPEGPIVDLTAVDVQLESHVRRMAVSEHLTDAQLDATTVRDQPPSAKKLPMIALRVSGEDPDAVRRDIDRAVEHLRALEGPVLASEDQRLRQALADLEAEVKWLLDSPVTVRSQKALRSAIFERTATQRHLSPARTYASHVLASLPVRVTSRRTAVLSLSMLGLVIGAFAGYTIAFLVEAKRRLR